MDKMHEYEMVIAALLTIGIVGTIGVFFASDIKARIKVNGSKKIR